MNKKVVVRVAARGYVDGRYIGEEKEVIESVDPSGRGKRGRAKPAGARGARGGAKNTAARGSVLGNDDRGNRVSRGGRGKGGGSGGSAGNSVASGRRRPQAGSVGNAAGNSQGNSVGNSAGNAEGNRQPRAPRGPRRDGQVGQAAQPRGTRNPRNSRNPQNNRSAVSGNGNGGGNGDGNFVPGVSPPRGPRQARPPRSTRPPQQRADHRAERQARGTPRVHVAGYMPNTGEAGNQLPVGSGNTLSYDNLGNGGQPPRARRNRGGKKTPFRTSTNNQANQAAVSALGSRALISEVAETRRWGADAKSGQFAEALAKEEVVKRERLHKVLAQSGHGSRRDMEIMITSGRVMVNGIVATTGTSVSASDAVMIDKRLVKLKFNEELPRVLLYHKPDGEIVTTNDPGNRITVFDNLPRVENGKWMSIGRLDINTSGLLIFTTSGELANRLMHPRYEVEREYAVRVLGELTEEQTQRLLTGISIATLTSGSEQRVVDTRDANEDEEDDVQYESELETDSIAETENFDDRPAKFDSIEARGGEGANHWYHVVLREGRNREVRKMFEAVGLTVSRLIRVRFGKIGLPPRLTRGRMMELDDSQARAVLRWVGMEVDGHIGQLPTNHQPNRGQRPEARGDAKTAGRGANAGRGGRGDREQSRPNNAAATLAEDGVEIDANASDLSPSALQTDQQNTERGVANQRRDRGTRGGRGLRQRNSQRAPHSAATPDIEGQDFVAGEAAIRAFTENQGDTSLVKTTPNERTPRRGRSRNVRRPREDRPRSPGSAESTAVLNSESINDNAGNADNQVEPARVRVERNDDDGAGNRVTAGSEGNLNRAAEAVARTPRESSAPKKPRAPRKPKVAVENDDNVGNR
jgi:23S rRNA pseudouridine2605 synthase